MGQIVSDNFQDDLGKILVALGLGDHARPMSPHQVVEDVVLPAIERLRLQCQLRFAGVNTEEALQSVINKAMQFHRTANDPQEDRCEELADWILKEFPTDPAQFS